jgi:hypothetical protein
MSTVPTPFDNISTAPPSAQVPASSAQVATPFDNIAPSAPQQASQQQDPSEIPETSYGAATWGAVKNLANDTVGAVKSAAGAISPFPQDDAEKHIQQSIGGTGAMLVYRMVKSLGSSAVQAHDIPAAIHDINQSKDPVGTYAKILQKTASQGAGQAITALGTAGVAKALPVVADVASGVKNVATDVIQGEKVAQAPAKATFRTGAQASATDAGVEAGAQGGSIRSLLDDPIESVATKERAAYDTINEASGTDLKSLYDLRNKLQDGLEDPTQIANEDKLNTRLEQTEAQIKTGEAQATKNGVDPDTLTDAKNMTKQRYAMENVNQKLFNNESVISGNEAHGAPESIDVKSAIRQVENLDKPSKFAPRGTPSRLEQAFGADGAQSLKKGLYDAQKAGNTAVTRAKIAKWVGGIAGVGAGEEIARHLLSK